MTSTFPWDSAKCANLPAKNSDSSSASPFSFQHMLQKRLIQISELNDVSEINSNSNIAFTCTIDLFYRNVITKFMKSVQLQ